MFSSRHAMFALLLSCGFAVGAQPAAAATMELISIRCVSTQERSDQLRLEIQRDNKNPTTAIRHTMRKGQTWTMNYKYTFSTVLSVRLEEEDPLFNDELGRVQIKFNAAPGVRTYDYKRNGAHYVLTYRVTTQSAYALKLISLRAVKAQEGTDEIRLKYKADGGQELHYGDRIMKTGQTWALNKEIPFNTKAELRLFDQDTVFDDNLGGHAFTPASMSPAPRTFGFNRDGARYELLYQVVRK